MFAAKGRLPPSFQVSFMGQGEPLVNRGNVFRFCSQLLAAYPSASVGISTVGIADGIRDLSEQRWATSVKLQLWLHAWPALKREPIVPAKRLYPIKDSLDESLAFWRATGARVCLNCVLLEGGNDSEQDAAAIAELARNGPFYAKVSSFNPFPGTALTPSSEAATRKFCDILRRNHVDVKRFHSIGTSVYAGCGQTALAARTAIPGPPRPSFATDQHRQLSRV